MDPKDIARMISEDINTNNGFLFEQYPAEQAPMSDELAAKKIGEKIKNSGNTGFSSVRELEHLVQRYLPMVGRTDKDLKLMLADVIAYLGKFGIGVGQQSRQGQPLTQGMSGAEITARSRELSAGQQGQQGRAQPLTQGMSGKEIMAAREAAAQQAQQGPRR